jgi:hypothetical protein
LTLLSVTPGDAEQKELGVMTPMKYEGKSLPLNQHDKLETFVSKDGSSAGARQATIRHSRRKHH